MNPPPLCLSCRYTPPSYYTLKAVFTPDEQGSGLAQGPGLGQGGVATVEAPTRLIITRARTKLMWSRGGYSIDVGEPLSFSHHNDEEAKGEEGSGGGEGRLCAVLVYARDGMPVDPYQPLSPTGSPTKQATTNQAVLQDTPSQDISLQDNPTTESTIPSWVKYYLAGAAQGPGLEGSILLPQGYVFTPQQMGRQTLNAVFDPR